MSRANRWELLRKKMVRLYFLVIGFILITQFLLGQELVPYRIDSKWGYVNKKGETVVEVSYDEVGKFCYNLSWVKKDSQYALINGKGELISSFDYDTVYYWAFNQFKGEIEGRAVCIDNDGNHMKCLYGCLGDISLSRSFDTYSEKDMIGMVKHSWTHKLGANIDRDTVEAKWNDFKENYAGFAAVKVKTKWGIINYDGNLVTELIYDSIEIEPEVSYDKSHFFKTEIDGKYGFVNREGVEIIEPKYIKLEFHQRGLAKAWIDEYFWGYVDLEGNEYFKQNE